MLGGTNAIATVAVKDLKQAREFYEGVLGLRVKDAQGSEAITFESGVTHVIVYRSDYAGTNKATAINWMLGDDIEKVVATLREKGVTFEHYDMPGLTKKGDVHVFGTFKTAWFKDPDGNILALMGH
ncbi:MAG TPA: VOC family protein [Polyangiaceae bacterium]|jgi:catechol 2,3-dioxygenase-like lactoylglutathione lyase family enzyme|nr:VOC family protein [Polyangiaceae bacterium]